MKKWMAVLPFTCLWCIYCHAQDSSYISRAIQLDEYVVKASRYGFDVNGFIKRVETDTTFYKAFKNLRIVSYTSDNDVRIIDKKEGVKASLLSTTRQTEREGCRTMQVLKEKTTGDFYTRGGKYNYYTARLYASLFFTRGKVCGETNLVKGGNDAVTDESSMEKHKDQLKTLIFNPGQPIPGVPIVGKKVAIFDNDVAPMYNFSISSANYGNIPCYVFTAKVKPYNRDDVVINELVTYFNKDNYEIVARNYSLSYKTWLFDFDVQMQVEMTHFEKFLIPSVIHYTGNWSVPFRKRERAVFTAKFYDFEK